MTPAAESFWTVYGGGIGKKGIEASAKTVTKTTTKEATEALGEKVAKDATKDGTEALGEKVAKSESKFDNAKGVFNRNNFKSEAELELHYSKHGVEFEQAFGKPCSKEDYLNYECL